MNTRLYAAICLTCLIPVTAWPTDGRLTWTGGVTEVDGAGGGGIVPWALIAGLGTADEIGGSVFATHLATQKFQLDEGGAALGIDNRLELSYAHAHFDIGKLVPGMALATDTFGAKLRVLGDAVYEQDSWSPQFAVGALYRETADYAGIPAALGARHDAGIDWYVAATKIFLDGIAGHTVLVSGAVRRSQANQYGLLGFGGPKGAVLDPEVSLVGWISDDFLVGVEWRSKRGALASPAEGSAQDAFLAWSITKNIYAVAAYADLGTIAAQSRQQGLYLSLNASL